MMIQQKTKAALIFLGFLFFWQQNFAVSIIPNKTSGVEVSLSNGQGYLKAADFVKLSPAQFSSLTGTRLTFLEKLYFKTAQRQLAREVKKNPDLLISQYYDHKKKKFKIDPLWFVLGVILGPLGVLFSFTNKQKKDKRKSAMLGCIVFFIWFGVLFLF